MGGGAGERGRQRKGGWAREIKRRKGKEVWRPSEQYRLRPGNLTESLTKPKRNHYSIIKKNQWLSIAT